jgi:hypothetical protein
MRPWHGGLGRGAAQTLRAAARGLRGAAHGLARRRGAMALCPFHFDEHLFEHEKLNFFE